MAHRFGWIALLFLSLVTPLHLSAQTYPIITASNATAIEQIGTVGGDQGRIALSPDDRWLAVAGQQGVWVINLDSGDEVPRLLNQQMNKANVVTFHPDRRTLVSGGDDGIVRFWNVETGEEIRTIEAAQNPVISMDFDPSGNTLAISTRPYIRLFNTQTGEEIRRLDDKEGGVRRVEFVNNTPLLLGATFDHSLAVWNLENDTYIGEIQDSINDDVRGMSISSDGTQFAVALVSGRIVIGNTNNSEQLALDYHTQAVRDVQFSPNNRLIASVGMDNVALLIDARNGKLISKFQLDNFGYSVEFSNDNRLLYVASGDGKVTTWDITSGQQVADHTLTFPTIRQIVFSPNNRHIAAITDEDNVARIFDVNSYQQIALLNGIEERPLSIAYRPTGNLIATASGGDVHIWTTNNFTLADTLSTNETRIFSVAFTPDPNVIAVGGEQFITLWNLPNKEPLLTFRHDTIARGLSISPDGSLIAASGGIWDVVSGDKLPIPIGEFASVAFSPNSDSLATTDRIIPVDPNRIRPAQNGYTGLNNTKVAFSPDGTLVAMATAENIEIIDVDNQSVITTLRGHDKNVSSITFSPDGRRIVSGSYDATIRIWAVSDNSTASTTNELTTTGIEIAVMPSPDSTMPMTDNSLTLDNINTLELTVLRQAIANVIDIDVSPDGSHAIIASTSGVFYVNLDNLNNAPIRLTPTNPSIVEAGLAVDYAKDGTLVVASHGFAHSEEAIGGGVTIWDVSGDTPINIAEYVISGDRGFAIALSNNQEMLAIGFDQPIVRVLNITTGEQRSASQEPLFGRINGLAFSPDDRLVTLSDTSGNKAFIEADSGRVITGFNSGRDIAMQWSQDGSRLYSAEQSQFVLRDGVNAEVISTHEYPEEASGDILTTDSVNGQLIITSEDTIWFLDYNTGEVTQTINGVDSRLIVADVTLDGAKVVGVTNDNRLHVWDIESKREITSAELGFVDPLAPTATSDDGQFIAIADRNEHIRIFSGNNGQFLRNIETIATQMHFLPASQYLATTRHDGRIDFWDAATGDRISLIETNDTQFIAISKDGNYIATSPDARAINVHNVRSGELIFENLRAHIGETTAITFHEDIMASGGADGTVKLWDLTTGEQDNLWSAHPIAVRGLAFAPTQSLIATISSEQVNVYNYRQASQTTQWFTFDLSIINLNGVFFSNDGNLLIVHADNMVHIWSMIDGGKAGEMRWLDGKSILTHNGEALVAVSPTGSIYKLALATVDE